MPVAMAFDAARGVLVVTPSGAVSAELFREALAAIVGSGRYPPDVDTLWDLRELAFEPADERMMRGLVAIRRGEFGARGGARVAMVVDSDLKFGVARQFELLAGDVPASFAVFRSLEEAWAWLGAR